MLTNVNASLDEKLDAIAARTPDQKMERTGVPVSIGGDIFVLRPMTRGQARSFREAETLGRFQALKLADVSEEEATPELLEQISAQADAQILHLIRIAIPELEGRDAWLDQHATDDELSDALEIARLFAYPNELRARTKEILKKAVSRADSPSSPSSTPDTPITTVND